MKNIVTYAAQDLHFEGIRNARELGGYRTADGRTVKRGLLLRTAALGGATETDLRRLREDFRVAHVMDFRSTAEQTEQPDPVIPGAEQRHIPVMDEAVTARRIKGTLGDARYRDLDEFQMLKLYVESGVVHDRMYVEFLDGDSGRTGYRAFFDRVLGAPEGRAVLWHCTNGKDRTGLAALLLLAALGVDEETALADYLLTNVAFAREIRQLTDWLTPLVPDEILRRDMIVMARSVHESYMKNALAYLHQQHGGPVGYLKGALGLDDEMLAKLRKKYTE